MRTLDRLNLILLFLNHVSKIYTMSKGTYLIKNDNRITVITGNYTAEFEGNSVKGFMDFQGLKVEFEGKVDSLPKTVEEANEIIKSLFLSPPIKVKMGSVVEAENDKVKIKAWGIIINDINSLFNKLSEIKIFPVDVNKISHYYDLPPKVVKNILKESPLEVDERAQRDFMHKYGTQLPRVEELGEFKVILDVDKNFGIARIFYNNIFIYSVKVSLSTLAHYLKLDTKDLIEELLYSLEALINLAGKATGNVLPGVVEVHNDGIIKITSSNEVAEIPINDMSRLSEFIDELRKKFLLLSHR